MEGGGDSTEDDCVFFNIALALPNQKEVNFFLDPTSNTIKN